MVAYRILFVAGAAAALPLNINLGAYSPALVVGDGEISFGGNNDVNGLMSVLQGAAVSAANTAAQQGAAQPAGQPAPARPTTPAAPAAAPAAPTAAPAAPEAAAAAAPAGQNQDTDSTLQDQAQQISALQGMGRAVLPREEEAAPADIAKRQNLGGFDRALRYAEAALTKGPKVQLGTGKGGAGTGILIDNNPEAAARPGRGDAMAVGTKRDLPGGNSRVKVTTMYVRSGVPASLQNDNVMRARSVGDGVDIEPRYETIEIAPSKRDGGNSNAIDAVNLNVSGDEGITMTFVETIDDAEDDA